ncbi:hypothetical protein ACHAQA_008540 [Verticillium albo-atrum]
MDDQKTKSPDKSGSGSNSGADVFVDLQSTKPSEEMASADVKHEGDGAGNVVLSGESADSALASTQKLNTTLNVAAIPDSDDAFAVGHVQPFTQQHQTGTDAEDNLVYTTSAFNTTGPVEVPFETNSSNVLSAALSNANDQPTAPTSESHLGPAGNNNVVSPSSHNCQGSDSSNSSVTNSNRPATPVPAARNANQNARPPTLQPAENNNGSPVSMSFSIKDDNGYEIQFSTHSQRKLRSALNVYCQRSGRAIETVRFILVGSELGMEDGDEIRAYQESIGGRGYM